MNGKTEDKVLAELASLYERRGYMRYRPGCFEDYSLYLDNIDFLISKNVITFSGAEGRLLALRPDITLSLISHMQCDGQTRKLFYTEKVYRRADGVGEFRDINQTGVEVVGDIDRACETEVAQLILDTLSMVSRNCMLDISHMGYTEGMMAALNIPDDQKQFVYACLRGKNVHDFIQLKNLCGLDESAVSTFAGIAEIGGDAASAILKVKQCVLNQEMAAAADELEQLIFSLSETGYKDNIAINFSIANNADYYNGLIFNGYIDGVPKRVLSGGRYDKLLQKLGKTGGAIGFALYLGELERFFKPVGNAVDVLILYDDDSMLEALKSGKHMADGGRAVRISRTVPEDIRYGKIVDMRSKSK